MLAVSGLHFYDACFADEKDVNLSVLNMAETRDLCMETYVNAQEKYITNKKNTQILTHSPKYTIL